MAREIKMNLAAHAAGDRTIGDNRNNTLTNTEKPAGNVSVYVFVACVVACECKSVACAPHPPNHARLYDLNTHHEHHQSVLTGSRNQAETS